jgi:hypothetical protein
MAILDCIKIGLPIPSDIKDFEALGGDVHDIKSLSINYDASYGYMYVPYYHNNINYGQFIGTYREAVSSRFSGCLMVAWQDADGIFAGHVQTEKDRQPHDCRDLWEKKERVSQRSFSFKPSSILATSSADIQPLNCFGFIEFDAGFNNIAAFSVATDVNNIVTQRVKIYTGPFTGHIIK